MIPSLAAWLVCIAELVSPQLFGPAPAAPHASPAQQATSASSAPPATDIFLAPLSVVGGKRVVGAPVNITNSPGYDNQPSFTPDGRAILFVSVRGGGTMPDIYRYDLRQETIRRVTETPEGEYSPGITPDGRHISAVRIEADKTQRLWRFGLDGGHPEVVLAGVKPVGYYAWADEHTLALYVLGQPATLQLADTSTGKVEIVVRGIGRSLQRIPGRGTISFVQSTPSATPSPPRLTSGGSRDSASGERGATANASRAGEEDAALWIRELNPRTGKTSPLVRAVPDAAEPYCAWTPDETLLMVAGDVLYAWRRGDAEWTRVADLSALGLRGVTRLAVSPVGDRLALVAEDKERAR